MKKVPYIPQFNPTECGVCVLAMILHYFGAYHPLREIRNHLPAGRDGISIRRLLSAFDKFGIKTSVYRGVIDNTSGIPLPAIAIWESNHYVIIERICKNYILIVDSNIGRKKFTYEEFNNSYSEVVILLSKAEAFKKKRRNLQARTSFSPILKYYRKSIILLVVLSLLTHLVTLSVPIAVQNLIDGIISMNPHPYQIIFFALAITLSAVFMYTKKNHTAKLGVNIDRDVNRKLISKLMMVRYRFYDIKSNAEVFFALDNTTCVKNIYLDNVLGCALEILLSLFILAYLLQANSILLLVVIVVLIPQVMLLILTDKPIRCNYRVMTREYENLYGQQVDMIHSILGIKTLSIEQPIIDKWKAKNNLYHKKNKDYQIKSNAFMVALSFLLTISPIVILIFAFLFAQRGLMTIGIAMAFFTMSNMLFNSIHTILTSIRNLRDNLISFERVEDIMLYEKTVPITAATQVNLDGHVEVSNVSFKYVKDGEYILKNVSCSIPPNSKVALIGDSGSGKSTFLKVLSGLYDVDEGSILYSDMRMDEDIAISIKAQIGFVAQNVWPMNQSIIDYLLLGFSDVTIDDVENACKIVNIHEEIMKMPMNYHTIISDAGKNISGGQCQRILLAKMILLKPKILLLDEATNALDAENEAKIIDYFYRNNCTIIMATHKADFLKKCDKVLVMKEGQIVAQENYVELPKRHSNAFLLRA